MYNERYLPKSLLIQWHITEKCNLSCSHCYQETREQKELSYKELLSILEQIRTLKSHWHIPIALTLTGGEPLLRPDLFSLLEEIHGEFPLAILTNGTIMTKEIAKRLRKLNPRFVQVSIEGTKKTHDTIRGEGSFTKACRGITVLKKAGVRTLISFTASKKNYKEFPSVVSLGVKLKVDSVWADRLIPEGSGKDMEKEILSTEEFDEFLSLMNKWRLIAKFNPLTRTKVTMNRALQFLKRKGRMYHCSAGDSLITIGADGTLFPCRRMPIPVGNILATPLMELYHQSDLFHQLRDSTNLDPRCAECEYKESCSGGLKCLSKALCNDPFKADPNCPLLSQKQQGVK